MKRLLMVLIVLFLLSACQSTPTQSTSWEKDGMRATIVEQLSEYKWAAIDWVSPAMFDLKKEIDAFVFGTITDVKEIELQYIENGEKHTYYYIVFDFKVDDPIYPKSFKSKIVRITSEISTRNFIADIEKDTFTKGKKYLIALVKASDDSPARILNYADYFIFNPISFMLPPDASDEQIARAFESFTSVKNKTDVVENAKETAKSSFSGFKEFLREYFK